MFIIRLFFIGLVFFPSLALAQTVFGFPPGTFQSRAALDASGGVATYAGPGDVVTTGWVWWVGLRAFSAAKAGTKAANVCTTIATIDTCADMSTDATTGNLVVGTIGGLTCNNSTVLCSIKILYDQSGGTNCTTACDFTQATPANRPQLGLSCTGSLPCIRFPGTGSQVIQTPNFTLTLPQPYSFSMIYNRTGNTSGFSDVISLSGIELFGRNATNTASLFSGAFGDFTISDGALHALQATFNNSSPTNTVSVDGALSSPTPGGGSVNPSNPWFLGLDGNSTPTADIGEIGWSNAAFSGTQQTNLCHNQRLYWGTSGSC